MSSPLKRRQDRAPELTNKQLVPCPQMEKYDTLIDINFCINKCPFYGGKIYTDEQGNNESVKCNFPRRVKIYNMAE